MENDLRVVRITNISNFDFTGEKGARYGGRDYLIPAGESLTVPFYAGDHFAKHLAQAIMLSEAPARGEAELNGKGTDAPLWNDERLAALKSKILSDGYTEEKEAAKTDGDILKEKIESLNKEVSDGNTDATGIDIDTSESDSNAIVYKDKAQVINELKTRGVTFDPRSSKATLETLLN